MNRSGLANIRIVLVEPAGALNVGSIARIMKNMELRYLVLVNPQCDHLSHEARQMAVHAGDVLAAAQVVPNLLEGLKGCRWAIATTGKLRTLATELEQPKTALPWLLQAAQQDGAALIFGPEDRGLNNTELNYAQRFLCIPSSPEYPSLNLAQAVAVCCYELYQLVQEQEGGKEGKSRVLGESAVSVSSSATPAPLEAMEGFYQHLEEVLLKIGYLYPHTADSRMKKFRRLFYRAFPSSPEVAMLRGILSQVEWALQSHPERLQKDEP